MMMVDDILMHLLDISDNSKIIIVICLLEPNKIYLEEMPIIGEYKCRKQFRKSFIEFQKRKTNYEIGDSLKIIRQIFRDGTVKGGVMSTSLMLEGRVEQVKKLLHLPHICHLELDKILEVDLES